MPKVKQIEQCKHPNSRKTKALAKQLKKQNTRGKSKLSTNIKQNLLGEKLLWFRDNVNPEQDNCTAEDVETVILKYLSRFDDELKQIRLKQSIGQRKNRQHANREDIIKMSLSREREEFKSAGIELPDLLNPVQFDLLKKWTGELRFLQNFKLRRFSLTNLKAEKSKSLTGKKHGNKLENVRNKDVDQQKVGNSIGTEEGSDNMDKKITNDNEESTKDSMDVDS